MSASTRAVLRYHPALVALHWLLAALIVAALALGALKMVNIPNADPLKLEALRTHMAGGAFIGTLMLARLFLRAGTARPAAATAGHSGLDVLAWASHRLFYLLVLAMVGSGLAMALQAGLFEIVYGGGGRLPPDFWGFAARWVHYAVSRTLIALIGLHVAGAFYHTIILHDGLLRRMAFGRRASADRVTPAEKRNILEAKP